MFSKDSRRVVLIYDVVAIHDSLSVAPCLLLPPTSDGHKSSLGLDLERPGEKCPQGQLNRFGKGVTSHTNRRSHYLLTDRSSLGYKTLLLYGQQGLTNESAVWVTE